jgi:uncharacterized cupin superfamily protein
MSDRGWFVVNTSEALWRGGNGRTPICNFEGEERFRQFGINVTVIEPGQLATLYHAEGAQEAFLIISGRCLLLIEDERRPLEPWDFVHCPAGTPHALVAGDERCVVVQVGARPPESIVIRSRPPRLSSASPLNRAHPRSPRHTAIGDACRCLTRAGSTSALSKAGAVGASQSAIPRR